MFHYETKKVAEINIHVHTDLNKIVCSNRKQMAENN